MLTKLIHRLLAHRHPWRGVDFSQMNQIYLMMLVRGMAIGMTGLFIPVFLLRIGYSLNAILFIILLYFVFRTIADIGGAFLVARFGPKHTMVMGQVLFMATSGLFLTLQTMHWPSFVLALFWGAAQSCSFIAFDVDFSKIKHDKHAGKELGYAESMGRVGSVLGPLVSGIVSLTLGPKYIFGVASILMFVGLVPILRTKEPTRTHQKLRYRDFSMTPLKPQLPSFVAIHLENTLSLLGWPLYLALFVLPGSAVYMKVGILSSISMFVAIVSAHSIGRAIDNGSGRKILRFSATMNAIIHLGRVLVRSYPISFMVGIANEVVTLGYRLPFFKAYYDQADDYPGHRIVFLSSVESFASLVKTMFYGLFWMLSFYLSARQVLTVMFITAALASLVIMSESFKTLGKRGI